MTDMRKEICESLAEDYQTMLFILTDVLHPHGLFDYLAHGISEVETRQVKERTGAYSMLKSTWRDWFAVKARGKLLRERMSKFNGIGAVSGIFYVVHTYTKFAERALFDAQWVQTGNEARAKLLDQAPELAKNLAFGMAVRDFTRNYIVENALHSKGCDLAAANVIINWRKTRDIFRENGMKGVYQELDRMRDTQSGWFTRDGFLPYLPEEFEVKKQYDVGISAARAAGSYPITMVISFPRGTAAQGRAEPPAVAQPG